MKIGIADNCGLKFCSDIKEWWEKQGHEVKYERGASEHLAQWADIYYVEWADNNIHYLYDLYHDDPRNCRTSDWDNSKKPTFVCRAIDWDIWIGHARSQDIVDWVDKWICIAPHLEKKLRADAKYSPPSKLKLIRPGVNLEKFTLKEPFDSAQGHGTDGFQIGMVLGDMWWPKNHMAGLDIFTTLYRKDPRWRLHIRGQHEGGEYWLQMYEHYLDSRGIRNAVTLYSPVADINQWYEQIDILLHPGMKESFCYAVAEAAAKGIPCIVNQFYGSEDIWPKDWLYQTHEEVIKRIERDHSKRNRVSTIPYREYIENTYPLEKMLKGIDGFIGI